MPQKHSHKQSDSSSSAVHSNHPDVSKSVSAVYTTATQSLTPAASTTEQNESFVSGSTRRSETGKVDATFTPHDNQEKELPVDEAQSIAESSESLSFTGLIQKSQEVYNSIASAESMLHQLLDSLAA